MTTQRSMDQWVLALGGLALLLLAGAFLWVHLELPPAHLLALAGLASGALAFARLPRAVALIAGPAVVATSTVAGGLWFAATKSPDLLPGLTAVFAAAVLWAWLGTRRRDLADARASTAAWLAAAAAGLAWSWASYFEAFTVGIAQEEVARRLVLTLLWAVAGVALVVQGRIRDLAPPRGAGYVVLAAALLKVLFYDTTHLGGLLRVASLAAAGAVLLGGWALLAAKDKKSPSHASE